MSLMKFLVLYEADDAGWDATVPDLNVFATARTRAEVERLVQEAVEFHIEGLRARNEEVPTPRILDASHVEVA